MIKGIVGQGNITVDAGNASVPYINQNTSNPMQGMMRVNGTDIQVFDSNNWININTSSATVNLSPEAESVLAWAREQKNKELQRESMVRSHPVLQKALAAIERAEANFDILAKLVDNYDHGTVTTSN